MEILTPLQTDQGSFPGGLTPQLIFEKMNRNLPDKQNKRGEKKYDDKFQEQKGHYHWSLMCKEKKAQR